FGVAVVGDLGPVTDDKVTATLAPRVKALREGDHPYPVCLFYFTMRDDVARYAWVVEPVVSADVPSLPGPDHARCLLLDRPALDEIVARVDRWYDTRAVSPPSAGDGAALLDRILDAQAAHAARAGAPPTVLKLPLLLAF